MASENARSVDDLLRQAAADLQRGRLAEARAALEAVVQRDPAHFRALHELALLACDARDPRAAIELFHRALAIRPDDAGAHCNLATAYKEAGRPVDALSSYDRAIALEPRFPEAHYNRGNTLKDLGRLEDAVASYGRAIELKPDLAAAHANRGVALLDHGQPAQALADFDRAIALRPGHGPAHTNRGNALSELGRLEEALASHERALALMPGLVPAHVNLGNACMALGRSEQALASFLRALKVAPNLPEALRGFSALLGHVEPAVATAELRQAVIRCLEDPAVESESVASASAALMRRDLRSALAGEEPADFAHLDRLTHGLLGAHLRNAPVPDLQLEALLIRARARLLENHVTGTGAGRTPDLDGLVAFAQQSFLNEYLWPADDPERERVGALEASIVAAIRDGVSPSATDVLLLAAYRPLHEIAGIADWCFEAASRFQEPIRTALEHLVALPAREAELAARIETLTSIDDTVSRAVRAQYEQNPYPRWNSLTGGKPVRYTQQILREIAPNAPPLVPVTDTPQVLIAGCGSGKQPLYSALRLAGSQVTAVDLSRASLAYAKRKALEMGLTNVRFAQADLLKLVELDDRYDVIECSGVLHHMADPEAGLAALARMLRPGGFIKLGLYSELARQPVARLRDTIRRIGYAGDREGIRALRRELTAAHAADVLPLAKARDFYTTSTFRDLLLHVQEHRFNLAQVTALLERARLGFLGFMLADPQPKLRYARRFPEDPGCTDLRNWERFETDHPHTFTGMYQFWCRKPV
jgi:tetratricopeptide (TPR) repeat protein